MVTTEPRPAQRGPLTRRERLLVLAASVAPIVLALVVLAPFVVLGEATGVQWVAAGLVYGGLLALAAGFVAYDRVQARQCPRCTTRNARGDVRCTACDYDLEERPRWRCSENHVVLLDAGLCPCGRRLQRIETPRGIGREVRAVLRVGVWMLAFLLIAGLVLDRLGG